MFNPFQKSVDNFYGDFEQMKNKNTKTTQKHENLMNDVLNRVAICEEEIQKLKAGNNDEMSTKDPRFL